MDGLLLIHDSKADVEEVGDYEAKVESKDGAPPNLRWTLNRKCSSRPTKIVAEMTLETRGPEF